MLARNSVYVSNMSWFHVTKLVRPVNQEADITNTLAVSQY